ncbi:MAG: hypothetical protein EPO21_23500 [Chloroflexota bacterium]|nr:MAG: hypothetical protein EPO21_23500 [Chloroflexota bacterium]
MKGLYKVLPPFAPDYSGVCSVLFDLGGLVVILDASGCTSNFTGFDEPRWYGSSAAVLCAHMREVDAVLGDDEKFLRRLENGMRELHPRFVALVGSPVPMVIGTDYRALARIITARTGLPALTFDTNGMRYYDTGASMAFLALARDFVSAAPAGVAPTMNIIGATPLDLGGNGAARELIALLAETSGRAVSCWAMGATFDDIARASRARLNLVVSVSGLAAARHLEATYGMPYLVGLPIGNRPTLRLLNAIRSSLELAPEPEMSPAAPERWAAIGKALVIGEQVMSNALRDCLRLDLGVADVTVASFFHLDETLREADDRHLDGEDDLLALTQQRQYDLVIGDPLYRELVTIAPAGRFVPFPHLAVSSRLYWDDDRALWGEAAAAWLKESICNARWR